MKSKYVKKNIEELLNSTLFKALLFLLIIMSLFTVLNYKDVSRIDSITGVFSNYIFLSVCIFPLFLFLNIYVYDRFRKDIFVIIRLKSKKEYLKQLIKNVFLATTIIFLIVVCIVLIMENLLNFTGYQIAMDEIHHCWNIIYLFFVLVKLYIFVILLSLINTLLINLCNNKLIIILNFIFFAVLFYCGFSFITVDSYKDISIFIGNYLVNNISFPNFQVEIIANVINYVIIIIVWWIVFFIMMKKKRDIE